MDAPRTPEELQKLRVVDLRKELSSHALPTTGKKDELVARLHKHLVSLAQETASTEDAGPSGEVGEPMEVDGSLAQQAEEERVAAEAAKLEQENEGRRLAEEKKAAEEAAEKAAQLEQQRLEEEKRMAEEQKLAEERQLAERAVAENAAEEKAAAEKAAEEKAAAEKAAQEKAAQEKAAEEKAAQEKAAEEKAAEERRLAEQKQQAEVQQKIAAAEQLRLSQEQEALQAVAQQRTQQVPDMMLLVQQQQALLDKQKTAHEANLRQGRQLQEQRQQLEAALRQNSQLQSENKGNQQMMEQLQQHRQQLLAQGEAISSQQSAVSEQATDYVEQRERNERLIKQVMEQQQLKESEEQKMLLLERQQRLLADHEQLQTAQQQAMEQQAKNAELLRHQQVALLERQREQEQAALQLQEQHRQQQIEAEQRRAEAMQREAEARKQKEEAAAAAKLQSERLLEQERVKAAAPPSLLTMETKPAAAGLKLTAGDDQADRKLPKALEDVLALKDIRAKQVGVEDMDLAVQGSRSTVSVRSAVSQQRPLGDVNEYDDDEDDEGKSSRGKESKNKKRKKKKKSRAARKAEEKRAADERAAAASEEGVEIDSGVEVEYVPEKPLVGAGDPLYSQFHKIFESFKIDESVNAGGDESSAEASKPKKETETETGVPRRGAALFGELENEDEGGNKPDSGKLSKKQMKKLTRMSVADLKTVVVRPDLVEMHDVTAPDPRLLLSLKATRNTVAVPRHWCNKRKYLQGKRGFEKPPFELPDYIKATGIMEMRQALADKESDKSLKQKMREKVRPKMGKIDIDYQKLHDAFFKFQRKPRMTVHGDLYYEGKEFETKLREKKPGNLTDDLRTALGMPIGSGAEKFPPPWLIAMQRYGPPPSYPNLKIPGLNAPIPEGCNFGYHAGGWGKPPVDETGRPLYGDVFGQREDNEAEPVSEDAADKGHWGEMESESEEESESESEGEEVADEETMATGIVTPADAGLITPSGLTSIPAGLETPDAIELRKKIEDSMDAGGGDTPALYQVLPEKKASVGTAMMGSAHTYDVGATKKMTADGVEVSLNPEELDMDSSAMQAKYEQTVRAQQADVQKEDFSDMVAEHSAKAAKKRKKQQTSDKSSKKHKEFKF